METVRRLKELAASTWLGALGDEVFGAAAELAYYFLLALFPLLICLTSVLGFLPDVAGGLASSIERWAPPEAWNLVATTLNDVVTHRSGGLLSIGLIGSVWSASSGMASLMSALNKAYDAVEARSFLNRRLVAIGLTIALALLVLSGSMLIVFGHALGRWLASGTVGSAAPKLVSTTMSYLSGLVLLHYGIVLVYLFGPNLKLGRTKVNPGAVFASAGIVIGSLLFSYYLRVAPNVSATYGSLGAVITLLLWLYLMGLMLLLGGEINSALMRASIGDQSQDSAPTTSAQPL